jgi:uncharacterized protein
VQQLGLVIPIPWLSTIGFAVVWLGLMLAYSPLADRIATHWVAEPPTLGAFRGLQQSRRQLIIGIAVAWVVGGFLEEVAFRGIVLQAVKGLLLAWFALPVATAIAIWVAALAAGIVHAYQGTRAMIIIIQLSVLFGLLFVISGYNLWAVILCHGLYDTIAFIRFAQKKSKYSDVS